MFVCVCLSLPSVFPAGDNQEDVALGGQHAPQGTIVAAPSRWVVVSVEARSEWNMAENGRHIIFEERGAPETGTVPRRWGAVEEGVAAWLRPVCTVPFSGRHGRRQQLWPERREGGGGDETRRGETVGLWLPPGERASDCSALRTGYCALSLSHMAAEVVLQQFLVLIATSRTASPPNGSHDAHMCIRPEVRRTVVQQEGGWELAILRFQ